MGLVLDRLLNRSAPQAAYGRPGSWAQFPMLSRLSATGANVTVDTAMELVPVYGAVSMLAGAIGSLPMKVYRDTEPREEATASRQWRMLHDQPNDEMAADEFWEIISASLLLWGNAFVYKERNASGVVQNLWPLRPSRVQVGRLTDDNGQSTRYFKLDGVQTAFETDILHIRGISYDGVVGLSPVQQARQQLANGTAFEEFQGTFLKNGLFPSLVFTHPNRLTDDAKSRLNEDLKNRSSWLAAGEVPVLEEGSKLESLSMHLSDAQFVEQANLSDHRIAQLFGLVPPHQWGVGAAGKSMTYTNSEFGGLEFVKWSVRKWLVRIENSVKRDQGIFPLPGPVLFPEFIVDALLRSDTLSRYQAYGIAIDKGFMSSAQVQALENIEPDDAVLEGTVAVPIQPADSPPALPAAQNGSALARSHERPGEALPRPQTESLALLDQLRTVFHPEIRVEAPEVRVTVPPMIAPDLTVTVDMSGVEAAIQELAAAVGGKDFVVNVDVPDTTVNVPAPPPVQLSLLPAEAPTMKRVEFKRNDKGRIESAEITEE